MATFECPASHRAMHGEGGDLGASAIRAALKMGIREGHARGPLAAGLFGQMEHRLRVQGLAASAVVVIIGGGMRCRGLLDQTGKATAK